VLSVGTSHIADSQYRTLDNYEILLGLDDDVQGKRGMLRAGRRFLDEQKIVSLVEWGLVGCKDAGDLPSPAALQQAIARRQCYRP